LLRARALKRSERVVLEDCCASYFQEFHEFGLKMIKAQGGIFGWVSNSSAVVEALSRQAA
jgi:nicotinamidase-related amidase